MRKVVLSMFVSLDGYIEGPNREFIAPPWSADMDRWTAELQDAGDALVFGRVCWQGLAEYWPRLHGRAGAGGTDQPQAEREPSTEAEATLARYMNRVPKYVFSRTLQSADAWAASTLVRDDPPALVAQLQQRSGGDIVVLGGADLAGACMRHDLFDEYRLLVAPQLYGGGTRLFADDRPRSQLELIEQRPMDTGAILLRYRRKKA